MKIKKETIYQFNNFENWTNFQSMRYFSCWEILLKKQKDVARQIFAGAFDQGELSQKFWVTLNNCIKTHISSSKNEWRDKFEMPEFYDTLINEVFLRVMKDKKAILKLQEYEKLGDEEKFVAIWSICHNKMMDFLRGDEVKKDILCGCGYFKEEDEDDEQKESIWAKGVRQIYPFSTFEKGEDGEFRYVDFGLNEAGFYHEDFRKMIEVEEIFGLVKGFLEGVKLRNLSMWDFVMAKFPAFEEVTDAEAADFLGLGKGAFRESWKKIVKASRQFLKKI